MTINCPRCSEDFEADQEYCPHCDGVDGVRMRWMIEWQEEPTE